MSTPSASPAKSTFALKFISGKYQGGEFPLKAEKQIVIGRSSELDMVLVEDMVSRKHARIVVNGTGQISIEDLGSTNGTLLDGAPIDRERIEGGDELTFGQTAARFVRRIDVPGGTPRGGRPSPSRRR